MKLSRREPIAADPATVWEFAVDVERWPDVMDHIARVRRHDQGSFGLGSAATLEQPGLPATVWTVDELNPGESFRWSGRPLGMRWTADHIIEPAGDGTTHLTLSVTATGWPVTVLAPLVRWAANRALRLEFAGFRAACEE